MDANTLWSRVNDAINTIIRRDESTETGEFLQPCIEGIYIHIYTYVCVCVNCLNLLKISSLVFWYLHV